jgi:hypothetical protein
MTTVAVQTTALRHTLENPSVLPQKQPCDIIC